jgi:hypothetical protein
MSCIAHKTLVKRWLQLVEWKPNSESAISAYLLIEKHRDSCEVCRSERLPEQLTCEQSVKVTLVIRFPVSK